METPTTLENEEKLEILVDIPYGSTIERDYIQEPSIIEYNQDIISQIKSSKANSSGVYRFRLYHPNANGLSDLKILHMCDLHFGLNNSLTKKKIEQYRFLQKEVFDLVLVTGDIFNRDFEGPIGEYMEFLSDFKATIMKGFVLGNHDYMNKEKDKLKKEIENAGFAYIANIPLKLNYNGRKITIIGIDDYLEGDIDYSKILQDINGSASNIAILHNLDGLNYNFPPILDLVLSGHTHAGEINLGFIDGIDLLKFWGKYKNVNRHTKGFKFLTERTLSYVDPGFTSLVKAKTNIPRIGCDGEGVSVLSFKQ